VLNGILLLLISQLAGEALARGSGIGIPGPVLGMAMLAAALLLWPRLQAVVAPVAAVLLPLLASEGLAIGVSVVVSTIASLIVTAFTFRAVVRLRDR
jgi:holin-like protein